MSGRQIIDYQSTFIRMFKGRINLMSREGIVPLNQCQQSMSTNLSSRPLQSASKMCRTPTKVPFSVGSSQKTCRSLKGGLSVQLRRKGSQRKQNVQMSQFRKRYQNIIISRQEGPISVREPLGEKPLSARNRLVLTRRPRKIV